MNPLSAAHQHDHLFGQDQKHPGEGRTLIVVGVTAAMMVVEVGFGICSGSMALLADGLHMASHAAALGVNVFAYNYARRHAHSERFSFGTGKVNALGGFTGAVLLGVFASLMVWESAQRFAHPVRIDYYQAIAVAVIGLVVNGLSVLILQGGHDTGHPHDHDHDHGHKHDHHEDHNLKSAYLHVLADALTSTLAIGALICAKYLNWVWMDPLMGVVGAVLVLRWSSGLLRTTSSVLLDHQAPQAIRETITRHIEGVDGARVTDLHVWRVAPKHYAAIVSILANDPRPLDHYKAVIPDDLYISHITIEIRRQGQ